MQYLVSAYILFAAVANCQQSNGNNSRTSGACSPAVTGNGNIITIKTCNTSEADNQKLTNLLSSIVVTQQTDTDVIIKKLDECFTKMANRHLTKEQKDAILAAIMKLPGHHLEIYIPLGNAESKVYAMDFVDLFRTAQWDGVGGAGVGQAQFIQDPVGIQIAVSSTDAYQNKVPEDALMLAQLFVRLGLMDQRGLVKVQAIQSGKFQIQVGIKPE